MSQIENLAIRGQLRKAKRIQNIMNETLWDIVRTPRAQRSLSYLALSSLLIFVYAYIFWWRAGGTAAYFSIPVITIGLAAWGLLSRSVRLITTLPNQFLDERQRELRDWAFQISYRFLVRSLIGLAAVTFALVVLKHLGAFSDLQSWVDNLPLTQLKNGSYQSNPIQTLWLTLSSAFDSWSANLAVFGGGFIYLAATLPLIVIALKEAKHGGGADL